MMLTLVNRTLVSIPKDLIEAHYLGDIYLNEYEVEEPMSNIADDVIEVRTNLSNKNNI